MPCKATRFRDRACGGSDMTLEQTLAAVRAAAGLAAGSVSLACATTR